MKTLLKNNFEENEIKNKKFLDIIEFLPEATFIIDINHKIVAWNKQVEKMTGINREDIIGKGNKDYSLAFYDKKRPILADFILDKKKIGRNFYNNIQEEDESIYVEIFLPKLNMGKGGYAWEKASPLTDKSGKIIGAIEFIRDVTDKKIMEENLEISEKKHREFTDALPETVFEADITGKITFINSVAFEQLGYTKEEILGKMNFLQFIDSNQIDLAKKLFARRLKGKPMSNTVFKVIKKNGKRILANIYTSIIKNENKIPIGLRGVVIDITEQQKSAEKLKESESKYQSLFELSPDAIGVITNEKIKFANMAMVNLLGAKSIKQIIGKNIFDFVDISAKNYVSKKMLAIQKGNKISPLIEESLIKLNGEVSDVELTVSPLKYEGSESIQIIARDISQRKKTEENLQKLYFESNIERQKMEAVMNSMGDAVFALDKEKNVILVNPIATQMLGKEKNNIIGKKYDEIFKFVFEKDKNQINNFIDKVYEQGKISSIGNQTVLLNSNGQFIPVSDSAAPIKDVSGKVVGCVVIFRDITRERQVDTAKSEFVSIASHQLRTPLSAIKWFLELITNGVLTDEQKHYLDQVTLSNERMIRLVNELLNVSRIETGNLTLRRKIINLNQLIRDISDETLPRILEKRQKIKLEVKGKILLKSDQVLLRQVIENLITNANRYTAPKGIITIRTFKKDSAAIFEIKDNGYGIPENQKNKLFTKFFRADNIITKQTDGTGLGLYVAKSAIETLGGKIWFESKENVGSTFYFSLPLNMLLSKV